MSPKRRAFAYDVFTSYSHRNLDWVRGWLVPELKGAGLSVCIDHECFEPGAPLLTEIERSVVTSRKTILVLTPEYVQSEWTELENILTQTLDPAARSRRMIPLLLRSCDLPLRIKGLICLDFTTAEKQREQIGRLAEAVRKAVRKPRKAAQLKANLPPEPPTGALLPESEFYIERQHDQTLGRQLQGLGSTTLLEGGRQMGKSSALARAMAQARASQGTVIAFDFQMLDEAALGSLDSLLRYLADAVHERLKLPADLSELWKGPLGPKDKLSALLSQWVLQGSHQPVSLVIDEADRIFGRPYQDDFFSLLRAWHNHRAQDENWKKFNLALAYSTDPRHSIQDLNQSPFNIGLKITLQDLNADECWQLNGRYGRPVRRKKDLESLTALIGGHPHLLQQALHSLASGSHSLQSLLDVRSGSPSPFREHLDHCQRRLDSDSQLKQAFQEVIRYGRCPDSSFSRLRGLGLAAGESQRSAQPRCRLYSEFFKEDWE